MDDKIPFNKQYECGKVQAENSMNRIVNGEDVVPPHSYPWMVTISEHKTQGSRGKFDY